MAYRIGKFVRRHRGSVLATLLVVLSITVGTVFGISQWLEAGRQRDAARNQESTATLIGDVLNFALNSAGGPERRTLSMAEHIERSADLIEQRYAHDAKFTASLLLQLAEILNTAPQATTLDLVQRAYELGRKNGDTRIMARASCNMARHNAMAGSMAQALENMQQVQRLLASAPADYEVRVECLLAEAIVAGEQSDSAKAIPLVLEAAQILERRGVDAREDYADVLSYLGSLYMQDNNPGAAIEVSERTARISTELGLADTADHLIILQNHAVQLQEAGEVATSLAERAEVNRLERRFHTADRIPLAYVYNHAQLLLRMDRTAEALAMIDRDLERARDADEPGNLLSFLQAKAYAHAQLGQWELSERALAEVRPLLEAGGSETKGTSEVTLANIALARNDIAAARQHVDTALALAGYGAAKGARTLKRTLLVAARVALAANQPAAAEKYATDALRISEQSARRTDSSADVGQSLLLLAQATITTAPPAKLRSLLQRAVACLSNGLDPQHRLTVEARTMLAGI